MEGKCLLSHPAFRAGGKGRGRKASSDLLNSARGFTSVSSFSPHSNPLVGGKHHSRTLRSPFGVGHNPPLHGVLLPPSLTRGCLWMGAHCPKHSRLGVESGQPLTWVALLPHSLGCGEAHRGPFVKGFANLGMPSCGHSAGAVVLRVWFKCWFYLALLLSSAFLSTSSPSTASPSWLPLVTESAKQREGSGSWTSQLRSQGG